MRNGLLDFLKSFNPQTQKTLLLDFVKTLREKFSSLSQNFLKSYESDSDSFDTDPLVDSLVDWIVDAMTLCFILGGEDFDEEQCELQQALRVCRDFVEQLTSRSLVSEEINQINNFFKKFDFEDEQPLAV